MEKNVLAWLEKSAEKNPDRTVYEDISESITFGELLDEAKRIGSAICEAGLSGKPIAVMMGRSIHTIAAYLGIVYSGHAYAPIDSTQPVSRIEKILGLLEPEAVIRDKGTEGKPVEGLLGNVKSFGFEEIRSHEVDNERLKAAGASLTETSPLYIIFTSGSSGRPKGVITSHHSLMNYIEAYAGVMKITEEDRLCSQSPLDYIAAIRDIYLPLLRGAYSFICPKEYFMQPDLLNGLLNDKRITCVGWSTSALCVLSKLRMFKSGRPEFLRKVCFSGSVMPAKVLREWQTELPGTEFINQYGPTEVTASCTYHRIDHVVGEGEIIPVGVPYENYKVFLLSDNDEAVEQGGYGEICVAGCSLALGYYNDVERTGSSFVQNPLNGSYMETIYRTGDIGRFREDGCLEFHGRRDRQIKHMGHRVELDEIEAAALASADTAEAAAVYDKEKETIWLFYSGNAGVKELIVGMRGFLPGFMVPRKVIKMETLPRLANGKTDLEKLKESF
ncbi:MAG: AMP-binding protein [Lachnospiraceae bacterium]|nr:AMP-binding protein [Lachnospiraceae bacterium]